MMNTSSRLLFQFAALACLGLAAACADSGHSLGTSNLPDAAGAGGALPTGGAPGTGGAHTTIPSGGSTGTGGTAGDRGGSNDAGGVGGDGAVTTCGMRGESCANRSCCGPLVCLSWSSQPSCAESYPPPADTGSAASDTGASRDAPGPSDDSGCPICPFAMRCTYGSPVDSNGCMVCACNPPPDAGVDTGCALPEGCSDAASTACPATPPAEGSICVGQTSCFYDTCPSGGRTQATCTAGQWVVETAACGEVLCQGTYATGSTCPSGQVCLARIGGARLISCIANACGTGPASPECTTFTTGCTPIFSLSGGVTYYCDTCTTGETCA